MVPATARMRAATQPYYAAKEVNEMSEEEAAAEPEEESQEEAGEAEEGESEDSE